MLIAASLRNCSSDATDVSASCMDSFRTAFASTSVRRISLPAAAGGAKRMLAEVLKAAGMQASSFPKDMVGTLVLAGFGAAELRSGMGLSTAELADAGYSAREIADSLNSGAPSPATLKELRTSVKQHHEKTESAIKAAGRPELAKNGSAVLLTSQDFYGSLTRLCHR